MEERSREVDGLVRRDRIAITAIVPTYNEERHIVDCLEHLLAQSGLPGDVEVLVVDGGSTDHTATLVRAMPEYGRRITLLENPRRLQVYAWNIGWRAARGEYIAMISAHAVYARDYLRSCLDALHRTRATVVGGVQRPYGDRALGKAIAWCMQSPFGMGNARFRYARREEEVDSVFGAFLRRRTLEELGGFDERVPFDEDDEINYRIRQRGGSIVVSPGIQVRYHVRESLKALGKQMYRYGYWRRFTQLLHPQHVPWRVLVPPAFMAALVASAAVAFTPWRALGTVVPVVYGAFALCAALLAARKLPLRSVVLVPVALATMHLTYGFGWWRGYLAFRRAAIGRSDRVLARSRAT